MCKIPLRGNTRATAEKKGYYREFFFKTNSLYELLSLYIRSTYIYEIIKKNSLNNINIYSPRCSLMCTSSEKRWWSTGARAASERELWNKFFFLYFIKYMSVVSVARMDFLIKYNNFRQNGAVLKKEVAILR